MFTGDDEVLDLGRPGSKSLWATISVGGAVKFVDSHRGKVLANQKDFTVLALHPSSYAYHFFEQDYVYRNGRQVVPNHRETYLKAPCAATFDAAWTFSWSEDAGAHVLEKASDPQNLFSGPPLPPSTTS